MPQACRLCLAGFLVASAAGVMACSDQAVPSDAPVRYHVVDEAGNPLARWDFVWDRLHAVFGASTPERITVRTSSAWTNQFSVADDSILLTPAATGNTKVVAHESTHLCMAHLTRGASTTQPFRFMDEGYASIMGAEIAGESDSYKRSARIAAAQESQRGNVSFAKVQDWIHYFGDPRTGTVDWGAYEVGASFDYFIRDTRGESALFALFVDIGATRDLGTTLGNVLAGTQSDIERQWLDYLAGAQAVARSPNADRQTSANAGNLSPEN